MEVMCLSETVSTSMTILRYLHHIICDFVLIVSIKIILDYYCWEDFTQGLFCSGELDKREVTHEPRLMCCWS